MLRRLWIALVAGAAVFVAGFVFASCGEESQPVTAPTLTVTATIPAPPSSDTTTTTTTTGTQPPPGPIVVRVSVVNGTPKGGIVRETVEKGDRVVIVVTSDAANHVHLHGYDILRDVAAGGIARIRFRATLPGRFEVELEDRGVQIAELTVRP